MMKLRLLLIIGVILLGASIGTTWAFSDELEALLWELDVWEAANFDYGFDDIIESLELGSDEPNE